jgi:4-hydroxyphenylpyruvate dioxygenase-like putative hemolysin
MQFNGEGIQHIALLTDDIWPASTACAAPACR